MKLSEIAAKLGARVLTRGPMGAQTAGNAILDDVEIKRVYAGDKMSDLLNAASSDTIVVTHLNNQQLIRAAELMDIPAICLLHGIVPDDDFIKALGRIGTILMSSPYGMFETCGHLFQFLNL